MSRTLEADDIKVGGIYFVKFVSKVPLELHTRTSDGLWTDRKIEVINDDPVVIISKARGSILTVFNLRCESFIHLWPHNLRE